MFQFAHDPMITIHDLISLYMIPMITIHDPYDHYTWSQWSLYMIPMITIHDLISLYVILWSLYMICMITYMIPMITYWLGGKDGNGGWIQGLTSVLYVGLLKKWFVYLKEINYCLSYEVHKQHVLYIRTFSFYNPITQTSVQCNVILSCSISYLLTESCIVYFTNFIR